MKTYFFKIMKLKLNNVIMKNLFVTFIMSLLLMQMLYSQLDSEYDFSQFNLGVGLSTLPENSTDPKSFLHSRITLLLPIKNEGNYTSSQMYEICWDFSSSFKTTAMALDIGGSVSTPINQKSDFMLGLSLVSLNFSPYHSNVGGSSLNLGYRYDKYFAETRFVFWKWAKGRDPVFRQDSRFSVNYHLTPQFTVGLQLNSYDIGHQFYMLRASWMFSN